MLTLCPRRRFLTTMTILLRTSMGLVLRLEAQRAHPPLQRVLLLLLLHYLPLHLHLVSLTKQLKLQLPRRVRPMTSSTTTSTTTTNTPAKQLVSGEAEEEPKDFPYNPLASMLSPVSPNVQEYMVQKVSLLRRLLLQGWRQNGIRLYTI